MDNDSLIAADVRAIIMKIIELIEHNRKEHGTAIIYEVSKEFVVDKKRIKKMVKKILFDYDILCARINALIPEAILVRELEFHTSRLTKLKKHID